MSDDLGKTQSLLLRIVDMRVLHVHPLPLSPDYFVTAVICYEDGGREYPATLVLPEERVKAWRMEPGDRFATVLTQKHHSEYHLRKSKEGQ